MAETVEEMKAKFEAQQLAWQKRLNGEKEKYEKLLAEQTKALESVTVELDGKAKAAAEGETALETMQKQIAALTDDVVAQKQAAEQAQLKALRTQVAAQHKLPPAMYDRIKGATLEEMAADAAQLAEFVKPESPGGLPRSNHGTPQGITAAQLNDPAFVRDNLDKVLASANGVED